MVYLNARTVNIPPSIKKMLRFTLNQNILTQGLLPAKIVMYMYLRGMLSKFTGTENIAKYKTLEIEYIIRH